MKRRTLDLSMSVGGTLLAVLAAVLGLVFVPADSNSGIDDEDAPSVCQ